MLLRRHRGALVADFIHLYNATPFDLWQSGVHLLDVAALADHLPPDCAIARALNPEHEWDDLGNAVAVATVNELRLLRADIASFAGKKSKPQLIERPGAESSTGPAKVDQIGASDGFDSLADMRAWYIANHPDMADRV